MSDDPNAVATQADGGAPATDPSSGPAAGGGEGGGAQPTGQPDQKAQAEALANYISSAINKAISPFGDRFAALEKNLSQPRGGSAGGNGQVQQGTKLTAQATALGLGEGDHGLLAEAIKEIAGDNSGDVNSLRSELARERFFNTYQDMREFRPQIEGILEKIDSGEMPVEMLVAGAVRGLHAQASMDKAKELAVEEFKKSEEAKTWARSIAGGGGGSKPKETPEAKAEAAQGAEVNFGVKNPKYTASKEPAPQD